MIQKPLGILFDWDGTLVDTFAVIHYALNATMKDLGLPAWTHAQTHDSMTYSLKENFPRVFGDDWQKARDLFYLHFNAAHLKNLVGIEGVEDTLKRLQDAGIYLAVVSNKTGKYLRAEAEELGWSQYFSKIIGASDAAKDKPAADPVYLALEGSDLVPSDNVWFVGDTHVDMECAFNAGLLPVRVAPPYLDAPLQDPNFPAKILFPKVRDIRFD